ncbi:TPA: 3',5'-cyclic-nucleotide phosphodiesterase [Legionella pneumophila]|uniref:MBL fold metallo-hydrolase n=1 Tax=Legionella sp. PATHC039 TaxID=2992042 RepID=UPI001A297EBC|nr:3',5'-cyclic-nucleotide phosphodiesterase [Legionella sp. PATHC039]HAT7071213.1 3',5'-cyclic-nucleotide phosphodiesterase [Legionella pneumophila]HAT8859453.1 3',5'-cyclic-nucleotide phosphodiesterase [Legionella pneumophila subsp. pneumophila]MCW8394594.1 3',5'-cyclic-nucleotide phosphodiesterase [Legionella sp. PATHC039]HAT8934052.1 3',5'-cyclic-nucleotide phosphodiesterase [Legionella pneumophila subsp. pneumophila]HAT9651081.1 3',5'-cyclic-nucleotide phosphodiesterase [Legionella pneumo
MRQLFITMFIFLLSHAGYSAPAFEILPLGVYGGLKDGNLSAYLIKAIKSKNYTALDGGTLVRGLEVAVDKKSLRNKKVDDLLQKHIPAYLISHAHLDHVMGLVMAQPELREKQTIMAREETMQVLQDNIFNWSVWGNFGDSGEIPHLNFQHYQTLPLLQWAAIPDTDLHVKAFPLSHGGMASSAFLIRYKTEYALYFGDTGADHIEKSTNLENIWKEIAPLIRNKQLHAIMLECSFLNSQPDDKLFGHLKPNLFMSELRHLASIVDPFDSRNSLRGLPVVVTHIKPRLADFSNTNEDTEKQIINELFEENDIGVELIKPEQGITLSL